jgi:hypothetical protein
MVLEISQSLLSALMQFIFAGECLAVMNLSAAHNQSFHQNPDITASSRRLPQNMEYFYINHSVA